MKLSQEGLILLHLCLWAQIGVITRIYLMKFFVIGCGTVWGPCLDGSDGIYTQSLPANMLGSMIMGVVAASSVLGLDTKTQLALLPKKHPWQKNVPLHIGIRTGFCGSLTTFATMQTEVMTIAIRANAWVNAVLALTVNLASSVLFYILGMHVALAVDRYLIAEHEDVMLERISYISNSMLADRGGMAEVVTSPDQEEELELERDLPRSSMSPSPLARMSSIHAEMPQSPSQISKLFEGKKTHCVTGVAVLGAFAGWAVGAALETDHDWVRISFFSALFGIFGCFIRYYLAQLLNYRLESYPWYPMGTLVANLLGSAIAFAMLAIQTYYGSELGYWAFILTSAVSTGFCGALSTVSTFAAELTKFSDVFPDALHVYIYLTHSLVGGLVLGIAIYGWAGWTA